jgi:hypothetical protein
MKPSSFFMVALSVGSEQVGELLGTIDFSVFALLLLNNWLFLNKNPSFRKSGRVKHYFQNIWKPNDPFCIENDFFVKFVTLCEVKMCFL